MASGDSDPQAPLRGWEGAGGFCAAGGHWGLERREHLRTRQPAHHLPRARLQAQPSLSGHPQQRRSSIAQIRMLGSQRDPPRIWGSAGLGPTPTASLRGAAQCVWGCLWWWGRAGRPRSQMLPLGALLTGAGGWRGWWTKALWGRDTAGPQRPGNKSSFVPPGTMGGGARAGVGAQG